MLHIKKTQQTERQIIEQLTTCENGKKGQTDVAHKLTNL